MTFFREHHQSALHPAAALSASDRGPSEPLEGVAPSNRVSSPLPVGNPAGRTFPRDDELCCPQCGRPYVLHGINCPSLSLPAEGRA
jgi:hypothetical protein